MNIIDFLKDKGDDLDTSPTFTAVVNGVLKRDGHLYAHADSRRGGGGALVY